MPEGIAERVAATMNVPDVEDLYNGNGFPGPAEVTAGKTGARISVATLGCKVNQCESASMMQAVRAAGYCPVPFDGPTDYCIVNTCAVTARSEYQSRQLIRRAVRRNPGAVVIVTGCYAQIAHQQIARIPGVTVVAGNGEKCDILPMLNRARTGTQQIFVDAIGRAGECTPCPASLPGRTRAFLKIQDGCNAFCSYCIVPYARGRSRSLPPEQVQESIAALGRAGCREVVITGINLGAYGHDLNPPATLLDICRWVEETRPIGRVRLSSLEPNEITDELISLMGASRTICPHFHIPLQSGDDRILQRMGRKYDTASVKTLLDKIHRVLPDAAIGLDVIVGFPGEGELEFTNTLHFLEAAPAAYFHVFSYSKRPETPAAQFSDQVGETEKKRRSALLRSLGKRKREAFAARFAGEKLSILVETREAGAGLWKGFSSNYIPGLIKSDDAYLSGRIVTVEVLASDRGSITGRVIIDDG